MNNHVGISFDDFLAEENLYSEVCARALKRVLAWQIKNYLEKHEIKKIDFAKKLKASRSQLDRLLDPENTNLSLKMLASTANAMGKHVEIRITD